MFHEGHGQVASDISDVGIPMDLTLAGGNAEWLLAGGVAFAAADHNLILENRKPNGKLFAASTSSEEITLEAWIRPGNLTQDNARILGFAPGDGTLERNWEAMQMGRNIMFRLRTSSASTVSLQTQTNPVASAGTTYHLVLTYAPFVPTAGTGGMRIYVDGVLVASNQECGTLNATGTNAWNASYITFAGNRPVVLDKDWQGTLSLAAVYSKAFSASSVSKNRDAGILEPAIPQSPLVDLACEDRLIPTNIVNGPSPWVEDKAASGTGLRMGNVDYAKGLGGKSGVSGTTTFLVYDLMAEGNRQALPGHAGRLTGFTGLQSGGSNSNTIIRISRAVRKPSDNDWLNGSGSVTSLLTVTIR